MYNLSGLKATLILFHALLIIAATTASAAPPAWSEALQADARLTKDLAWLDVGQEKALYLYRRGTAGVQRGAVVILHDLPDHADWPSVVRPLRNQLPAHGWETLSLQLPPAADPWKTEAYLQAVGARIAAALALINKTSDRPVMLLGVGTGASAAAWFLSNNPKSPVRGLIAVSPRPFPGQSQVELKTLMAAVSTPILEVFAERDHPNVLEGVSDRETLAAARPTTTSASKDRPARYRQMAIEGAEADYTGQADVLTKRIRGWMRLHTDR